MVAYFASNREFKVVVDIRLAAIAENMLDLGHKFAVLLWAEEDVLPEPLLRPCKEVALFGTCSANFKFPAIIAARPWMGL